MQFRKILLGFATSALTACGGGGGGGSREAPAPSPSMSVSTTQITVSARQNSTVDHQMFTASVANLGTNTLYAQLLYTNSGIEEIAWTISGDSSVTVNVFLRKPSELDVGVYSDQITVHACLDPNCNQPVGGAPQIVNVSYTVTAAPNELSADTASLMFAYTQGHSSVPAPESVQLSADGPVNWSASANVPWLQLSPTTGSGPGALLVTLDPSGLSPGLHWATITISNLDSDQSLALAVELDVQATSLAIDGGSIVIGGNDGCDLADQSLTFNLETGSNAHPWSLSIETDDGADWLHVDADSGSVSATGAAVAVNADLAGLAHGMYTGTITLTANVDGSTITEQVPVSLNFQERRIFAVDAGIALTQTSNLSALSRETEIRESCGSGEVEWVASSDQSWLTVTPSGNTGSIMTLTANPAELATDTLHRATVVLTATDAGLENDELIQVGLWVGSTDTPAELIVDGSFASVATDPVRPYVYAHNGGSEIRAIQLYTGARVSLEGVGASLRGLAVSRDGSTLYGIDQTNQNLIRVDLDTLAVGTPVQLSSPARHLATARPNGYPIVLLDNGDVFDPTGNSLSTGHLGHYADDHFQLDVSGDSRTVCGGSTANTTVALHCWSLSHSAQEGGVRLDLLQDYTPGNYTSAVAVNRDGSRVHAGMDYLVRALDTADLGVIHELSGSGLPNAIAMDHRDRIFINSEFSDAEGNDEHVVSVFDSAGSLVARQVISDSSALLLHYQLQVSGDGLRFAVLTNAPHLRIQTAPE